MVNHNGMKFTTQDRDGDTSPENCAARFKGTYHGYLKLLKLMES